VRLAARYTVIGHGHPRAMADLAPWYRRAGIEVVADFADVCRRADLLAFDNSSVGFEFASTGRPVVLLDPYHYRRGVHHGLRFWDAVPGLVCQDRAGVPDAVSLTTVVERALEDPPEAREAREHALELVYAHRSGAAERAANVLLDWAKDTTSEDDPASPVGAPVGPRGTDSDEVAPVVDDAGEPA
jgi:CDP-glycerol glycerophosphotransferase (TagB/SpsB family)